MLIQKKKDIEKRLKKRINFNRKLLNRFRTIQFKPSYKKNKSNFVIKNNFTKKFIINDIKQILKKLHK